MNVTYDIISICYILVLLLFSPAPLVEKRMIEFVGKSAV